MHGAAVEGDLFDAAMGREKDRAARSFVNAARLHADKTVFHEIKAANAVLVSIFIELG